MFKIKPFIILRLYGGLGNQLFSYAAALRLAESNNIPLYLDTKSGFFRDSIYRRVFRLESLQISAKKSHWAEILGILFTYYRLLFEKMGCQNKCINNYIIIQKNISLDLNIISKKLNHPIFFEGFWQSELYFKDISDKIRSEFKFKEIYISDVLHILDNVKIEKSVAIHIRHFNDLHHANKGNVSDQYYFKAIQFFVKNISNVEFWLFSDQPELAQEKYFFNNYPLTIVSYIIPNSDEIKELFLMSKFKYFIIANSTFSWWGAWLSNEDGKVVVAPSEVIDSGEGSWGFHGLLPDEWVKF